MLSDAAVSEMERHVQACDQARETLDRALRAAEEHGSSTSSDDRDAALKSVAAALKAWQDAQYRFMQAVERSEAPDVPTAAMLLRQGEDIDATNARRGLPGAPVDGTDQPFDMDLSGTRGQALTTAAMEYLPALEE